MLSLLLKYQPRTLADILGQAGVVRSLKQYITHPYSTAMLFHGDPGIGKTAAAHALARELGCAVEDDWLGGLFEVASGALTGPAARNMLDTLQQRPLMGSGWKVALCNEADRMTEAAETIFLDGLERLPPKTVVVFTTNAPEHLTQRLRDRCECYAFEGGADHLRPHIRKLAARVWKAEGCQGLIPGLEQLGMPTLQGPDAMFASFRLALQQLAQLVREYLAGGGQRGVRAVRKRLSKSVDVDVSNTVTCDHCGLEQECPPWATEQTCPGCKKVFPIER
jgi:hypothetical protein